MITYQQKIVDNIIVFVSMKFHPEMEKLNEMLGFFFHFLESDREFTKQAKFCQLVQLSRIYGKGSVNAQNIFTKIKLKSSCMKIYLLKKRDFDNFFSLH